jgi:hypothetical protein
MSALAMPRSAEVPDVMVRPMLKSTGDDDDGERQ